MSEHDKLRETVEAGLAALVACEKRLREYEVKIDWEWGNGTADEDDPTELWGAEIQQARSAIAAMREQAATANAAFEDSRRIDSIAPGFRVLKGDHKLQVWWHVTVNGKTEARSVVVPADEPNAIRSAIDAIRGGAE